MTASVRQFFYRYIDNPSSVQGCLGSELRTVEPEGWLVFTLSGLYQTCGAPEHTSYESFRHSLYASQLNEALAEKGCRVDLYQSTGKIDTSWYVLKPISQENAVKDRLSG
ncbi:MAG: hypothetical protein H6999_10410 [Hahellaceae bacterium]|nr:hypothetical protein [Hahellaceae bacterium]MCP5170152.1 hypothetical protein [Hahellaceae bacterium]